MVILWGDGENILPPSPSDPKVFLPNENNEPSIVKMTLYDWPHLIYEIFCPSNDWTISSIGRVSSWLYSIKS